MSFTPSTKFFIKDSSTVGTMLICCSAISLIPGNSAAGISYSAFRKNKFTSPVSGLHLPASLLHYINDVLMAVFFFSAGLEIKREVLTGGTWLRNR